MNINAQIFPNMSAQHQGPSQQQQRLPSFYPHQNGNQFMYPPIQNNCPELTATPQLPPANLLNHLGGSCLLVFPVHFNPQNGTWQNGNGVLVTPNSAASVGGFYITPHHPPHQMQNGYTAMQHHVQNGSPNGSSGFGDNGSVHGGGPQEGGMRTPPVFPTNMAANQHTSPVPNGMLYGSQHQMYPMQLQSVTPGFYPPHQHGSQVPFASIPMILSHDTVPGGPEHFDTVQQDMAEQKNLDSDLLRGDELAGSSTRSSFCDSEHSPEPRTMEPAPTEFQPNQSSFCHGGSQTSLEEERAEIEVVQASNNACTFEQPELMNAAVAELSGFDVNSMPENAEQETCVACEGVAAEIKALETVIVIDPMVTDEKRFQTGSVENLQGGEKIPETRTSISHERRGPVVISPTVSSPVPAPEKQVLPSNQATGPKTWANIVAKSTASFTPTVQAPARTIPPPVKLELSAYGGASPVELNKHKQNGVNSATLVFRNSGNGSGGGPYKNNHSSRPHGFVRNDQYEFPRLSLADAEVYPDEMQIYMRDIPIDVTTGMIANTMRRFGEVEDVRLRYHQHTRDLRFCYVLFKDREPCDTLKNAGRIQIGSHSLVIQTKQATRMRDAK